MHQNKFLGKAQIIRRPKFLVGPNFRRPKIFVGPNFRHLGPTLFGPIRYVAFFIPALIYGLSIVFSSVDDFNLKFKKQSEKLKHYEGEYFKIADTRERREIGA